MKRIISLILAAMMLVSVFSAMNITASAAIPTNGWYQDEVGDWQYYENGDFVENEWRQIKGVWYYFGWGGWMYKNGVEEINGNKYYFNKNGAMQSGGWIKEVEKYSDGSSYTTWYHAKASGALDTGWVKISGKWYHFSDWGTMSTGIENIDGKIYAFDKNGAMLSSGWKQNAYGDWFYIKPNGECYTGWQKIGGKWYYLDKDDGYMYIGPSYVEGKIAFFNSSGVWVSKPANGWNSASGTYFTDSGKSYKYTVWCYVENGKFVTDWKKISGKWYYFDKSSGFMYNSGAYWIEKNEAMYFFEKSGAMRTTKGWAQEIYSDGTKGMWYYVNADGTCKTGWITTGGKSYYLDPEMAANKSVNDGKGIYIVGKDGAWIKSSGWQKLTYFDGSYDWFYIEGGMCTTGWKTIKDKTYYFDIEDGTMYTGWHDIDDESYYFDDSGALVEQD